MQIVELRSVAPSEPIQNTVSFYEGRYGVQRKPGVYSVWDWARITFVFNLLLRGSRVLDVGVGSGQLINTIALSGEFASVTGIDIATHSKFVRMTDSFDLRRMDVASMSFEDNFFDVVICMEVLEHLDEHKFRTALAELRRVCRSQLILSVPFEEPKPLPRYHKQRFDSASIQAYWPNARKLRLRRPGTDWLLLEERS